MGDLSKHFSKSELTCKCGKCSNFSLNRELICLLELIREHYKIPVVISSGYRCQTHNLRLGGSSSRSQHLYGRAADIYIKDINPLNIYTFVDSLFPNYYGLGLYDNFVHIDVREVSARW